MQGSASPCGEVCGKEVESASNMWDGCEVSHLVLHVLQYILWALEHDMVSPAGITMEWLDKARDGTPGALYKALGKIQMAKHCERLVADLPAGTRTKANLEAVVSKFGGYEAYHKAFATPTASTLGEVGADASTLGEVAAGDPFDEFRQTLCKTGATMLDFLFDWFAGDHDKDLENLCKKQAGSAIGLLAWAELAGEAASAWHGVLRQLGVHKSAVSLADGGPPDASSRSLKRMLTEEGVDETDDRAQEMRQERVETWKNALAARKSTRQ